jgi:Tfp pilus assembly protein PilE
MWEQSHLTGNSCLLPKVVTRQVPNSVTAGSQRGFSSLELLIVAAVAVLVATIGVPHLQKTIHASENENVFAVLRTVASAQVDFYAAHDRFARLNEINDPTSQSLGTPWGNNILLGRFTISMAPAVPTDAELRTGYTITATRAVEADGVIYKYELTQSGDIRQVLP